MNNSTKQTRAQKGGEIGMNGEQYAGGTFLPNTDKGKMKRNRRAGSGKQEIAPFVWEVPAEGMTSLYQRFAVVTNIRTGEIIEQACRYYGKSVDEVRQQYAAWKAGERWVKL